MTLLLALDLTSKIALSNTAAGSRVRLGKVSLTEQRFSKISGRVLNFVFFGLKLHCTWKKIFLRVLMFFKVVFCVYILKFYFGALRCLIGLSKSEIVCRFQNGLNLETSITNESVEPYSLYFLETLYTYMFVFVLCNEVYKSIYLYLYYEMKYIKVYICIWLWNEVYKSI